VPELRAQCWHDDHDDCPGNAPIPDLDGSTDAPPTCFYKSLKDTITRMRPGEPPSFAEDMLVAINSEESAEDIADNTDQWPELFADENEDSLGDGTDLFVRVLEALESVSL